MSTRPSFYLSLHASVELSYYTPCLHSAHGTTSVTCGRVQDAPAADKAPFHRILFFLEAEMGARQWKEQLNGGQKEVCRSFTSFSKTRL